MLNYFNAHIKPDLDHLNGLLGTKTITIKEPDNSAEYRMNEDGLFLCTHKDYYVERACCSGRGSSGYIECACGGQDEYICPNPYCTGIEFDSDGDIL